MNTSYPTTRKEKPGKMINTQFALTHIAAYQHSAKGWKRSLFVACDDMKKVGITPLSTPRKMTSQNLISDYNLRKRMFVVFKLGIWILKNYSSIYEIKELNKTIFKNSDYGKEAIGLIAYDYSAWENRA
jgi:hypothetical protein